MHFKTDVTLLPLLITHRCAGEAKGEICFIIFYSLWLGSKFDDASSPSKPVHYASKAQAFFFLSLFIPAPPHIAHCYYVFPTMRGKCNDSFSFVFLDYLGHNFNVKVLKRVVKSRCAWNVIFLWLNKWIRLQLCRKSETKHKVVRKQEYTKRNLQAFYSEHRNCFDIENR